MEPRVLWEKVKPHLPLIGVVALALATRLFRLTWPGIWTDEGFSIGMARSSLPDLVVGTANDLHPPLFYVFLKIWLLPGWSDWYVRLFPALWDVGIVLLVYWMGRTLFNRSVGAWAGFYMALSPIHQYFGRQVRMYVMLVFLASLSVYLCWRWVTQRRPWFWAGYVIVTVMALYTQNVSLFILPVENVLVLIAVIQQRRWRTLLPWVVGQLLLLIGYMPWVPEVIYQGLFHQAWWIGQASLEQLNKAFPYLLFGQPHLAENEGLWRTVTYAWMGAVLLQAGVVYLGRRHPERRPGIFAWGWLLLLVGVIFTLVLALPLYQEKQLLLLTVPLVLLAGMGTASLPPVARIIVVLLFLALIVPSMRYVYTQDIWQDWGKLTAYMEEHAQPGDALVINPGAAQPTLDLFLDLPLTRAGYPLDYTPRVGNFTGQVATPEIVEARLRPLVEKHRRVWLIECSLPEYWDPRHVLPAWLEEWGKSIPVPNFVGIRLHLYQARD